MSTETRQLAGKRFGLGPSAPCLYNTCCNGPSACLAEMLLQDRHPEQGAHIFSCYHCMSLWRKRGKRFSKEHLVITALRIHAHSSSVLNSVTLSSWGAQQRHVQVFWTGREKMDGRQFCGRFRYISGKRQMIHHTSDSSYSHNCESSSTAQAIKLIRRDWDDINSENQREEKIFGAVCPFRGQAETFQHTVTNQNLQLKTCMKEQPGKGSWKPLGSTPAPEEKLMPSAPKLKLCILSTL